MSHDPLVWLEDALRDLDEANLRRKLITHQGPQTSPLLVDGKPLANFASNDYLGLAGDSRLADAACQAARTEGWGAGSSPLIVGHALSHETLERRLARFEETEAALLFSSGYAANVGAITALVSRGDAVFSDALNHASIIDGCRLSRADVHIFEHASADSLLARLRAATGYRRRLIVTDSVFSMQGDLAPLAELAELAERFACMLMVDEAHATGVFGPRGTGAAEQFGVERQVHVRMGTLSKALGCAGGFVSGSQSLIDWLINRGRPYIFSTAGPAANSAAALAALDIVRDEPQRRSGLISAAGELRHRLRDQGWNVPEGMSPIIPVMAGQRERALELAARLRAQGFWVPAIRPPSVPEGESCLRITVCCSHSADTLASLVEAFASLRS